MKVNPYIFRGYDIRGVVDRDLNSEIVEHIGRGYGTYLKRRGIKQAVIARDSRATSPAYSKAVIKGLAWAGIDTVDIGMNLVGTFYWAQYYFKVKGGAYVTASHNPVEYNGFKFAVDFSETLVSDGIQELRRIVEEENYEKGKIEGRVTEQDIREAYFKDLIKRLPIKKKFKVVIDSSCTTAGVIAPDLLRKAGCTVIESNTKLDPSFPLGTADPTAVIIVKRLGKKVVSEKADIGFSYDSDGDRIGIVDEKGHIIWNDVLVALFAIDMLYHYPKSTIMYNDLCSKIVKESIVEHGGTPFMWKTGHSFLKKKNQEVKAVFIGELSGHFFFSRDFYNHDDGLYSTLRLLSYLSRTNQPLSKAISSLPLYISSPEIKLYCVDEKKIALMKRIIPILKKDFPDAEVIDDERTGGGVRLDMKDSMFIIRYSQNGPYITIKFEAKEQREYNKLKKYINNLLHTLDEIDWESNISLNLSALT